MKRFLPFFLVVLAGAPACAQPQQPQRDGSRILQQLEKADANGDGSVSRAEFTAFRAKQFDRLDRDHDGFLMPNDIPQFAKNRMPDGMSIDQMIKTFDKNGDGKVSREEFVNGPTPAFDLVDANKDGVVTPAEFEAAKTKFQNR